MRLIVGFTIAVFIAGCSSKRESVQPIRTAISESVYAYGIVKSKNQYEAFATVNGRVGEVLVTEGDVVKRGQPILRLVNVASQLNAENAQLAAEFADVKRHTERLNELKINIELARSKMSNDSLLLVRQQNLWKQNIGSLVEVEQRELAYRNSVTTLRAAELRYSDTKRQLILADQQSKKNLQITASAASDYTIVSEMDGLVYRLIKKKGELVTTQSPVAVIGEADHFMLELQVDEYDIARIARGQQVIVRMDSYPDSVYEAVILRVDPLMNERSKSFTVEAEFVNRPATLYPNLTVEANIILLAKANALTIPRVYLVNDSTVIFNDGSPRRVVIGLKDYQRVEIISGLDTSDLILRPQP